MSEINLLVELYNLDMRIDENASVLAALETKLADSSKVDVARGAFESTNKHTAELKARLRTMELEANGLTEKLKQINERLYSGRITNAKELAGLNQDEQMVEKSKRELEDRELALMEQIEAAEETVAEKRAEYERIAAETSSENAHERAALREHRELEASLLRKQNNVRTQVSPESLRVYDDLRRLKKGRAVAMVKGDSCSACGYAVPSGLISRVRLGSELVFCSNCGRILAP
jgi:predicted  nucleic acid-binding Zn-ribbon protein